MYLCSTVKHLGVYKQASSFVDSMSTAAARSPYPSITPEDEEPQEADLIRQEEEDEE